MAGLMEIVVVFYFPIFFLFLLFFFALLFLPPCHLTCCAAWSPAITRFGGWHCLLSSDVLDGGLVVAWWWNWMEWDERDEMRCDVIPRWLAWFGVDWIGLDCICSSFSSFLYLYFLPLLSIHFHVMCFFVICGFIIIGALGVWPFFLQLQYCNCL
ncbi:hypothetical protein P167DRAFT_165899 [Morchella conica CCBAS932]|uniref:Transmembrane protein n=1 Tax=Morchella conica CCBAS932 TaxID=1392247 RepID=A0A3N4L2E2_9PEZI|nr:hypothetical protein P167DRAFT_165899 [Morchella conica CCBAS932]